MGSKILLHKLYSETLINKVKHEFEIEISAESLSLEGEYSRKKIKTIYFAKTSEIHSIINVHQDFRSS